jgi:cold shock CspA family protein
MVRGAIRTLIHLSTGTDLPTTHLVPAANSVGYGYIAAADGDVFFDYSAVKNLRFDQLKVGMTVEYALDQAPYLRSSDVTIVADPARTPGTTEVAV